MFFDIDNTADATSLLSIALTKKVKEKALAFQDVFELNYSTPNYKVIENYREFAGKVLTFDVESFANFFCVIFKLYGENKFVIVYNGEVEKLAYLLNRNCVVGFNSRNYDVPMCALAMRGMSIEELHKVSFRIITQELRSYDIEREYEIEMPKINHIDLIEVAPLQGSLKLYAGRLNTPRMQDLPVYPEQSLGDYEVVKVIEYCMNDDCNTELLLKELEPALTLRAEMSQRYGVDVRSRSDAQIAESVISKELERINGYKSKRPEIKPGTTYFYKIPHYISYVSPQLNELLDILRRTPLVVEDSGYINLPESLEGKNVNIGSCIYRIGIGGLHSSEKSKLHKANETYLLLDRDVVSYYPYIIINDKLYPAHLGLPFLEVYKTLVVSRVEDKKAGRKSSADSKKIIVNGTFGKLGNMYSLIYSPDLLMQVTITGQLALLMLIDMLEYYGISVVSANTDGVMIKCDRTRTDQLNQIVKMWEGLTGFETEEARYKAVYQRDVNNYIAITEDGKVKTKGTYSDKGSAGNSKLSRNPEYHICNDAVIAYLTDDADIETSIRNCKEIVRFCAVRNVKGGAIKSGVYLGKTIRYYQSTAMQGEINYKLSGNKVPLTDGARPLMELPATFPTDINYNWYIQRCEDILIDLGVNPAKEKVSARQELTLFDLSLDD